MIGDLQFLGAHYFAPHYFGRRYFTQPVQVESDHRLFVSPISRLAIVAQVPRNIVGLELNRVVPVDAISRVVVAESVNRLTVVPATEREA